MNREQSSAQDAEAGWEPRRDSREERAVRQEPDGREFLIIDRETVNMRSRRGRLMDQEDYDDGDYGEDPFPDEPENTGKKKNIPLIIAIVVICIVLIAGIGIAVKLLVFDKNDKNGDGDGRSSAITREDEEDSAEDEEEAQPDADYDLTEDSWQTLTGEIDESGGEKYLSLDRSSSFYGQDDMADEEVLVEDVDRVMIDDSFLPDGMLDDALYEAVSMSGEVRISDGELSITAEAVEDESGDDMIAAYEEAQDTEEGGIHRYELIVKDCTWEEAFEECRNRGGYLARINSQEEMGIHYSADVR